jgi:hypothetical protein
MGHDTQIHTEVKKEKVQNVDFLVKNTWPNSLDRRYRLLHDALAAREAVPITNHCELSGATMAADLQREEKYHATAHFVF